MMAAALMSSMGVAFSGSSAAQPIVSTYEPPTLRHYKPSAPTTYGSKGAGISMAQQKRAARKARNVRRHKSASRR